MRISRNSLAFMSVLAAGVLLAGATVLLPSAKTYGSETDEAIARELAAANEANARNAAQPAAAPSAQQPAPPAAPVENPAGATAPEAAAGGASPEVQLPNTGTGGYATTGNTVAYLFIGLGLALMGSGSLVWAFGRKRR